MNPFTTKIGAIVHILVPFNAIYNAAESLSVLHGLKAQNAAAVFIPVNRG